MNPVPEIALVVSTYQRPRHLELCLLSIALQEAVAGRFEVVVCDDGSSDGTADLVERGARRYNFPLGFTTHSHDGFQLARCRNEGAAATRAPYLLFVDGDCLLPRDHLRIHLEQRRVATVNGSDTIRLSAEGSRLMERASVSRGDFSALAPRLQRLRLQAEHWEGRLRGKLGHAGYPKLVGNNIALWRSDFERINGFDQKFRHWGCEDADLRMRLVAAGVEVRSLRHLTCTYHLWHPRDASAPPLGQWSQGRNVPYLQRGFRLTRCCRGLQARRPEDLVIRLRNAGRFPEQVAAWLPFLRASPQGRQPAEVEILFLPGADGFSGRAECNVLVLMDEVGEPPLDQAHILVADDPALPFAGDHRLSLGAFFRLWDLII